MDVWLRWVWMRFVTEGARNVLIFMVIGHMLLWVRMRVWLMKRMRMWLGVRMRVWLAVRVWMWLVVRAWLVVRMWHWLGTYHPVLFH